MSDIDAFVELALKELEPALVLAVKHAAEYRDAGGEWHSGESILDMHENLIEIRKAQDSLEGILARVSLVRAEVAIRTQDAREAYDDAVAGAMAKSKPEEYSTAKERQAGYDLNALEERMAHRRLQRTLAKVDSAREYIQLRYRGLDGKRRDLDTRLRALSIESRLEH